MSASAEWTELETLYGAYVDGDAHAARSLFEQLKFRLGAFFRLRTQSAHDAEDLVQVALLKIHFSRDRFDRSLALKTWIFTIAGRCMIDHWRGGASESRSAHVPIEDANLEAEEIPLSVTVERIDELKRALVTLKPIDQSIVYLSAVEGFSMAEIGTLLGLSEAAVKARASRSYREVRPLLTGLFVLLFWLGVVTWMQ